MARLPSVIGHEPAGEVVEVGARVSGFKVGDHVALDPFGPCGRCGPCTAGRFNFCDAPTRLGGAFAEFCIAPVTNSWLVPKSMDMESAAMLEPFATGVHAVENSWLQAGDSAVVEGPGPIGLSAALSARALGVTSIVITGLKVDAERLELARRMGFKTVCASDRDWIEQVRALMPPGGADVVFDAAGSTRLGAPYRAQGRRAGRTWMAGARYRRDRDALAVFPRRQNHSLARAHARDLAARDRDGGERRGRSEADGDASL